MSSIPPDLPKSNPPEVRCPFSSERWLGEDDDIEVTQLVTEEDSRPPEELASWLRLETDLTLQEENANQGSQLLKPTNVPKRRRSPITVQEWVATLPVHHNIQRENLESSIEDPIDDYGKIIPPKVTISTTEEDFDAEAASQPKIDANRDALDIDPSFHGGLRRLSATLEEMEEEANDSQSDDEKHYENSSEPDKIITWDSSYNRVYEDSIRLGEEAGANFNETKESQRKSLVSLAERRRQLLRSHKEFGSFQSDFSSRSTVSSVDTVLLSRTVDPSELLLELGFGGPSTPALSRIPTRFFTKSHAKGISVATFLKSQEEIMEKFDSGFSGYRGLSGHPDTRPSQLVEKIIDRIRTRDRLKRQATGSSLISKISKSKNPGFVSIVNRVMDAKDAEQPKGLRAFRAAVHSVLSPANREYMVEQAKKAQRSERSRKKLVIAGKTFSIDEDDLSVVDEESEKSKGGDSPPGSPKQLENVIRATTPDIRVTRSLNKRDSSMSLVSSCSLESDWSDDELDELEKMFGSLQHKSSAVMDSSDSAESGGNNESRWRQLKASRKQAIAKMRQQKATKKGESIAKTTEERHLLLDSSYNNVRADERVPRRFSQQHNAKIE